MIHRLVLLAIPTTPALIWYSQQKNPQEELNNGTVIVQRCLRNAYTVGAIVTDYKWNLSQPFSSWASDLASGQQGQGWEPSHQVWQDCHTRGAQRLLQLCFDNGAIYTKIGQHIAQLDYLLPDQYVNTMKDNLLSSCPITPFEQVKELIKQELGAPVEDLFASLDERPIASASIAQVHLATDIHGRKLAVKVQHPGIREQYQADLYVIQSLMSAVHYIFPQFDYTWLVEEIKYNFPRELNFKQEANNAEQCRQLIESSPKLRGEVCVPVIYKDLSSERMLTMEYINGLQVCDAKGMNKLGINTAQVSYLVSQLYAEMIFRHGFVHCDPHEANILVRPSHNNGAIDKLLNRKVKPEVVILDHGLYRELDDDFKYNYAKLWSSLVLHDETQIEDACRNFGIQDSNLFVGIITAKPYQHDQHHLLSSPATKSETQQIAKTRLKGIHGVLSDIPRPLILLLKTNDCLRSINKSIGETWSGFAAMARQSFSAVQQYKYNCIIQQSKFYSFKGIYDRVSLQIDQLLFKIRMFVLARLYKQYIASPRTYAIKLNQWNTFSKS